MKRTTKSVVSRDWHGRVSNRGSWLAAVPASMLYDENGKKLGAKKVRKLAMKEEKRRQNEV